MGKDRRERGTDGGNKLEEDRVRTTGGGGGKRGGRKEKKVWSRGKEREGVTQERKNKAVTSQGNPVSWK